MPDRKADAPLSVEIPSRDDDRPAWGKVGAITVIGFVVGVAWPHVAGVRVGPSLPADALLPATSASAAAGEANGGAPGLDLAAPARASASTSAPSSGPPSVSPPPPPRVSVAVGHGGVFSCRTASDELLKGTECGTLPGLDGLVVPALRKLADCPSAAGATGQLRLVVRVDFGKGTLGAEAGKNSTVAETDGLLACARTALADVRPTGLAHDNQRYGVSYHLTFGAPAAPAGDEKSAAGTSASPAGNTPPAVAAPGAPSDSEVQVSWDVAIVRDAPRTGKIVAKLDRGTSVRVGAVNQGWYPVKYGDGFASEGWVYRGAIGR
ncbi:MAG: SH3 domain-containing protein [Polyangiaceae bacterium]